MIADLLTPDLAGFEFEPLNTSWRPRDTMLYALGVGAKPATELEFLYEGKGPLVLPTYAVIPAMLAMGNLRQAVKLKLSRLLHGEQSIELLRPLPAQCEITLRKIFYERRQPFLSFKQVVAQHLAAFFLCEQFFELSS